MTPHAFAETPLTRVVGWWIDRPIYVVLVMLACLWGGYWGLDHVGRLEDQPFPMGWDSIIKPYPGATAEEVEQEVTDVIETALQ